MSEPGELIYPPTSTLTITRAPTPAPPFSQFPAVHGDPLLEEDKEPASWRGLASR
jgi:hypothetical protein